MKRMTQAFAASILANILAAVVFPLSFAQAPTRPEVRSVASSGGAPASSVEMILQRQTLTYPSGYTFTEAPDPLSGNNPTYPLVPRNVPAAGESFNDLRFGTVLTRVTQIEGVNGRHEYSRHDPFNLDQSMIVLLPEYHWRVYRTQTMPYNQSSNLVMTLHDIAEPRWDPVDPDVIWGLHGFRLLTVNVQTGQTTVIKDFSQDPTIGPILIRETDLYRITMKDEGESSLDKRFWAFLLQGSTQDHRVRYIFTWDRQQDRVLGLYSLPQNESNIDWVGMSPRGSWVLIGGDWYNAGNLAGLTMANKELTQFHRLDYATAHSDVGLDIHGNEVIVMQNVRTDHIDLIPIDWNTQPILEAHASYDGTNRTPLIRLFYASQSPVGLNSGVHISCNVPGYCVVSTYIEPGLADQNWLDRTITLVRLDRNHPRVFYLAKVYNTTGAYWEETQATITNDGSKVVWASNWNQNVGGEQLFLMQLDMPPDWMGPVPDIKGNGADGPLTINPGDNLSLTLQLSSGNLNLSGESADWWLAAETPFGWFFYNAAAGSWASDLSFAYQGPVFALSPVELMNISGLPAGAYNFYFGLDMNMNGSPDYEQFYYDSFSVNVTQ